MLTKGCLFKKIKIFLSKQVPSDPFISHPPAVPQWNISPVYRQTRLSLFFNIFASHWGLKIPLPSTFIKKSRLFPPDSSFSALQMSSFMNKNWHIWSIGFLWLFNETYWKQLSKAEFLRVTVPQENPVLKLQHEIAFPERPSCLDDLPCRCFPGMGESWQGSILFISAWIFS